MPGLVNTPALIARMIRVHRANPVIVLLIVSCWAIMPAKADDNVPPVAATLAVQAFDLRDVKLLEGPFKIAMDRNAEYLLQLEPDRFLHYFRTEAGLTAKAPAYGGWENQNQGAGRCLGHYLSALSLQFRASGDKRFKDRIDYIVGELSEIQAANRNGYLGAEKDGKLFWAELASGNGEALNKHRVPWYIQHKLFAGLRDAFQLAGNEKAKSILIRLSDWAIDVTARLDDAAFQNMLQQEHGGMREVLCDVYAITLDRKYLMLADRFYHRRVIDPLMNGQDDLAGLHANTQIPKLIGEARYFELTGETAHRQAARFFWDTVVHTRTFANGGNSDDEHFGPAMEFASHLGLNTSETCNTYNMLKLTQHLFEWDPRIEYADYTERALYNHILASLGPSPGNYTYYVPMKTGHYRTFSEPDKSFWCCVGTGMENHTKYAGSIYYHNRDTLYVNSFIPSELNWNGMIVRQETDYPLNGNIHLTFSGMVPRGLKMMLRVPAWAGAGTTLSLNGRLISREVKTGCYLPVTEPIQSGDRLEFNLPVALRTESLPDDANMRAIFFGPLLLCGQLEPVDPSQQLLKDSPANKGKDSDVPALKTANRPLAEWIVKVKDEPLTFETHDVGLATDLKLVPFYRQISHRYILYWNVAGG